MSEILDQIDHVIRDVGTSDDAMRQLPDPPDPSIAIEAELETWDPTVCPVNWDTHGCGLPHGHGGNHRCVGAAGCGDEVDPRGRDASGFQWRLWGTGVDLNRG